MRNQARQSANEAGAKAKMGRALLLVGSVVLLGEAAFLMMQLSALWQSSGAARLGWVAAAGTIVQRAVAFLAWNDGLLLAAAAKVLVLCCPLLAMGVGLGLVRSTNLTRRMVDARERATPSLEGEQE